MLIVRDAVCAVGVKGIWEIFVSSAQFAENQKLLKKIKYYDSPYMRGLELAKSQGQKINWGILQNNGSELLKKKKKSQCHEMQSKSQKQFRLKKIKGI